MESPKTNTPNSLGFIINNNYFKPPADAEESVIKL